jgi:hypothetical protein
VREAAGGSCRRWRMRPCSAQGPPCRSSSPQHACTTRRGPHHHRRATPPSLHLSRETFPPSRRAPPPRAWHRASSMHAEPHRSKQVASTPSAAAEPHSPAATADEDAAEALRGEVAEAGDSDCVDAPVERALVDGRLDAMRQ